jgi:hypothetical protein
MKFRFWDRIVLLAGAVAVLLVGLSLLTGGLSKNNDMSAVHRTLVTVLGFVCTGFGGYLLMLPRRYAMQRKDYVVQRTDTGELRIAVKAIENLVEKCIDLHEEIQLISMSIMSAREGVVVELNISLANNISIPLAVASLQKQIKQYLVAASGIEVREVRVSVESTKDEPLLVAEIEEEEENEPEKAPMHQRLFCQAEQPTIVPAPPKPEEGTKEEQAVSAPETEAKAEEQKDEQ